MDQATAWFQKKLVRYATICHPRGFQMIMEDRRLAYVYRQSLPVTLQKKMGGRIDLTFAETQARAREAECDLDDLSRLGFEEEPRGVMMAQGRPDVH